MQPVELDNANWSRIFRDPQSGLREARLLFQSRGISEEPKRVFQGSHLEGSVLKGAISGQGLYEVAQSILGWFGKPAPRREFGNWQKWLDFCEEFGLVRFQRPGVSKRDALFCRDWFREKIPHLEQFT